MLLVFTLQEPGPEKSHDRVKVARQDGRTIIAMADGAGGMSGAAEAADQVVSSLAKALVGTTAAETPDACAEALAALDQAVASNPWAGETTGLLVVISDDSVVGASVGDCAAWVVPQSDEPHELTVNQIRKPRIGTGRASSVGFGPARLDGVLIVMTDGIADYVTGEELAGFVRTTETEQLSKMLLNHVRLPSGQLPDHATVVIAAQS